MVKCCIFVIEIEFKKLFFMKKLILGLAIAITSFSCENKAENLYQEVYAIHEEVMPQLSDVRLMTEQLEALPDSITMSNDSILIVKADLLSADAWMMKWMGEFDNERKEDEAYLTNELKQVSEMKTYFNKAISNAKKILADLP